MKVVESPKHADAVPVTVRRTWEERLLSWPWQPWVGTKGVMMEVPRAPKVQAGGRILMHPETAAILRSGGDIGWMGASAEENPLLPKLPAE